MIRWCLSIHICYGKLSNVLDAFLILELFLMIGVTLIGQSMNNLVRDVASY